MGVGEKNIMSEIETTNVVASRRPKRQPTGTLTAHATICFSLSRFYQRYKLRRLPHGEPFNHAPIKSIGSCRIFGKIQGMSRIGFMSLT